MKNYNYADEIIKDYDSVNLKKVEDQEDILQNILKSAKETSAINSQDKIRGFMEGLKTDNNIGNFGEKK